jgi:Skp family chaperone for outer membrane proteins
LDSDAGKAAVAVIEKAMEPMKTQLEKLSKEMQELQTKLQNSKTEADKAQINADMKNKSVEGQRVQEDAQRLSQDLQQKHLQGVAALANKIVEEYAKENDLAIVIDPSTEQSNIIFAAKTSDITNEVIRRMNAAYSKDPKVVAPAAAAKPE